MNTLAVCTELEDSVADYNNAIKVLHILDDVGPRLESEYKCIDLLLSNYLDNEKLQYLRKTIGSSEFFEKIYGSTEAWKVTETITAMLTRLKNFFTRSIQYIKVFVVIRIAAATTVIFRWAKICDQKKDEVEKYLKGIDKKEIDVRSLNEMLLKSTLLYKEFLDQFTKVTIMTPNTAVTADNAEKLVEDPPSYNDWLKLLEKVENENPRNKETNGKAALSLLDGHWGDAFDINRMGKACGQAKAVMEDLNRLDMNAKKIISELSESDDSTPAQKTDNDKGKTVVQTEDLIKRRKLAFLKRFSSEVMTKLIGTFVRYVSFCAQECEQFIKAFDKTQKKAATVKA